MFDINSFSSHQQGELLAEIDTPEQAIQVRQWQHYRWLHFDQDAIQAAIDLGQPDRLLLQYCQAMTLAILFHPSPNKMLNLGCGCGSFERFFQQQLPELSITSVDSSAEVIELGHQYFGYPDNCQPRQADATDFIINDQNQYDWLFCDLHQQGQQPDNLQQPEFYRLLKRRLKDDGVLVINFMPVNNQQMLEALLAIRHSFDHCHLLPLPGKQNHILFAHSQTTATKTEMNIRCQRWQQRCKLPLAALLDSLIVLPRPPSS